MTKPAGQIALTSILLLLLSFFLLAETASGSNQAGLVVDFGNGQMVTNCVDFAGEDISGFELLQNSGLDLEVDAQGLGAAVCRIEETGCPAGNCFCQCRGADCQYWSYWHQIDGEWVYAGSGAGSYRVKPGAVDGWSWGPGSVTEAVAPDLVGFAEICRSPTAVPLTEAGAPGDTAASASPASASWWPYVLLVLLVGGLLAGVVVIGRRGNSRE